MSEAQPRVSLDDIGQPCCDYCGCRIDEPDQDCFGQRNGGCAP